MLSMFDGIFSIIKSIIIEWNITFKREDGRKMREYQKITSHHFSRFDQQCFSQEDICYNLKSWWESNEMSYRIEIGVVKWTFNISTVRRFHLKDNKSHKKQREDWERMSRCCRPLLSCDRTKISENECERGQRKYFNYSSSRHRESSESK